MKSNFIFIFIFILQACVRTLPDEELTMTRTPYAGKEIRLDGYYTGAAPGQSKYYDYKFFYSNGVLFSFATIPDVDIKKHLSQYNNIGRDSKTCWQIFQVENNVINVQGWTENGSDFIRQYVLKNDSYTIINDTTLFYENSKGYKTNYYFKKFSPKPDSTNVFIK